MIDPQKYFDDLRSKLLAEFGDDLLYLGMQGSYLRGEATESSDIDAMVILRTVDRAAIGRYRSVIASMDFPVEPCGFLCGADDMRNWNALELCQLRHTTKDLYGDLNDFLGFHTRADDVEYARMSLGNLYHALCHSAVYNDRVRCVQTLPRHAKSLFYILQMLHYLRTGDFLPTHAALLRALSDDDKHILSLATHLKTAETYDYEASFDALLDWCKRAMAETAAMKA